MSLRIMQFVDNWVGTPLAWFFSLFCRTTNSLIGDSYAEPPKRIICAKFLGMGSTVLSFPLLKECHDKGIKVAFWSFSSQADLVRLSGCVDEVWTINPSFPGFFFSLFHTLKQARDFKADAFIDMEPTARFSALLARLSGAKNRIGFMCGKYSRERLFTHLVSFTSDRHFSDNCVNMGKLAGIDVSSESKFPEVIPCALAPHFHYKRTHAMQIVININTSELTRVHRSWPISHWIELCSSLLKDKEVELVFPGTKGEQSKTDLVMVSVRNELAEEFSDQMVNLAGRTSISELLYVLKNADLVISVDSGIMHLAAWLGTPVIGLFGPETPRIFGPRSSSTDRTVSVWKGLPCSPCAPVSSEKHTRCRDNQCMKRISPSEVLEVCQKMIGA